MTQIEKNGFFSIMKEINTSVAFVDKNFMVIDTNDGEVFYNNCELLTFVKGKITMPVVKCIGISTLNTQDNDIYFYNCNNGEFLCTLRKGIDNLFGSNAVSNFDLPNLLERQVNSTSDTIDFLKSNFKAEQKTDDEKQEFNNLMNEQYDVFRLLKNMYVIVANECRYSYYFDIVSYTNSIVHVFNSQNNIISFTSETPCLVVEFITDELQILLLNLIRSAYLNVEPGTTIDLAYTYTDEETLIFSIDYQRIEDKESSYDETGVISEIVIAQISAKNNCEITSDDNGTISLTFKDVSPFDVESFYDVCNKIEDDDEVVNAFTSQLPEPIEE